MLRTGHRTTGDANTSGYQGRHIMVLPTNWSQHLTKLAPKGCYSLIGFFPPSLGLDWLVEMPMSWLTLQPTWLQALGCLEQSKKKIRLILLHDLR